MLAPQPSIQSGTEQGATSVTEKRGKKRARIFEGDEVFKVAREIICRTDDDRLVILTALDSENGCHFHPDMTLTKKIQP